VGLPDDDDDDDDVVDGVRLCLCTAASNGPIIYPQVIYVYGEPWWNDYDDSGKLLTRLWQSYQQRHLVESRRNVRKE
jgi:hypothetical protein